MRIAILGATGMLGQHTARAALARGHELVVVYRDPARLARLNGLAFTPMQADLDDRVALTRALAGAEAVINCAAYYPAAPRGWRDEVATATAQMDNFYAACAAQPLRKIVYVGGSIALRRHPRRAPGNEMLEYFQQPRDRNPYLQVKWAMDQQARERAFRGLPVVIGIPAMSFGEYDYGPSTGRLIVGIAGGRLPGYVRGIRNVVYAGDAGRGLVLACERGRPGERYLLTGSNVSMDELVATIARLAGVPPPRPVALPLAHAVARLQALRYRLLGGPLPKVDATAIAVMSAGQALSGAKALRELDYRAELPLEQTIARTLDWFRQQGYIS